MSLEGYYNYLSYQDFDISGNIVDESPRFFVYSAMWGVLFSAMYPVSNAICREMFPKFYAKLPEGMHMHL